MDDAINDYDYDPHHSNATTVALQQIRQRLEEDPKHKHTLLQESHSLRIHSMKQHYSFDLLNQFYQELMIPNFPFESERDDLDDWIAILDPEQMQANHPGPDMDVLLLVLVVADNDNDNDDSTAATTTTTTILAGLAVEHYKRAQTGLLAYCVVETEVRRRGILGAMHPVAVWVLQQLHTLHSGDCTNTICPITILAETNTIHAGDVSRHECQARHRALYRLGYRLLQFPYIQPPLQEDDGSFDEIMLLVHCGNTNGDGDENEDSILLYPQMEIPSQILHGYVVDFSCPSTAVTMARTKSRASTCIIGIINW
jgi:hypothetical protein